MRRLSALAEPGLVVRAIRGGGRGLRQSLRYGPMDPRRGYCSCLVLHSRRQQLKDKWNGPRAIVIYIDPITLDRFLINVNFFYSILLTSSSLRERATRSSRRKTYDFRGSIFKDLIQRSCFVDILGNDLRTEDVRELFLLGRLMSHGDFSGMRKKKSNEEREKIKETPDPKYAQVNGQTG